MITLHRRRDTLLQFVYVAYALSYVTLQLP